ncbi:MAG: transcription-repair coupling factor [Candidatus Schekmanbacteria bacterium]|nr:MAG: transcription-repair coupling factor [Candidatus Schekmanbacteria bacterium]
MEAKFSEIFEKIKNILESSAPKKSEICGLTGASFALLLSWFHHKDKQIIYIAQNEEKAKSFYEDILFFKEYFFNQNREKDLKVHYFPPRDTDIYEEFSPDQEIASQRIECLLEMIKGKGIFITVPSSLQLFLMPKEYLEDKFREIDTGDLIDRDELIHYLISTGYKRRDFVEQRGEFSVRGGIIDFFSGNYEYPVRIELFGDEVASIREFDQFTQKSLRKILTASILPVREVVYDEKYYMLKEKFLSKFPELIETNYAKKILRLIEEGEYFQGIENYLPLFYSSKSSLFDYFSEDALIILDDKKSILKTIDENYKNYEIAREENIRRGIPSLELDELALNKEAVNEKLLNFDEINLSPIPSDENSIKVDIKHTDFLHIDELKRTDRFYSVAKEIKKYRDEGFAVFISAASKARGERLIKMFMDYNLSIGFLKERKFDILQFDYKSPQPPLILIGFLSEGFISEDLRLVFVTEKDIFGTKREIYRKKTVTPVKSASTFESLKEGDYVVHTEYGIGIFKGIQSMITEGRQIDFLLIEYSGGEKLYVPIDNFHLVQKYIGVKGTKPVIDRLGGTGWIKRKERVQKAIDSIAKELVELYALRQMSKGFAFSPDDNWLREFESKFEYEETPHQAKAIEEVKRDMESPVPMDRLICGDVGYGKTEVAMRAAFKAVLDGKQVAVLVPTTILAHQHFKTFQERFSGFPIRIEMFSRFVSKKYQKKIIDDLEEGKIDIVIGTHALVINRLRFRDLGLLIIDEEHRFGVKHKEKLKNIKKDVDVLTLTATPIPRTLQFSLMGIRDISIIETPPEDRLPIKTFVSAFNKNIIRKGILNEKERGGQIYFVHNRVQSIEAMKNFLEKLVPEIKIGVAHGQMKTSELERIMIDFINKKFDLLLSTTIIESGIDIPSVNTIIINRADKLGLAQLYQLRGRVGRSRTQSYAYILVPHDKAMTKDAIKRLRVIEETTDLGSGFKVAMHDLEIRGGGNILGEAQSGQIAAIGYDLYCKLIRETIAQMKGEEARRVECKIELKTDASIPTSFIADSMKRVSAYRRISEIEDFNELDELKKEFIDKYGPLPPSFEKLFLIAALRIKGREMFIDSIAEDSEGIIFNFSKQFKPSENLLNKILSCEKYKVRFRNENSLLLKADDLGKDKTEIALSFIEYLN